MQRTKPPYRADHVGSLIRPDALIKAREQAEQKAISPAELARIQQAAIRDVVRMQEELGLKLVTDGEYNRHSWHRDFMLKFQNVRMMPSKLTVRFQNAVSPAVSAATPWMSRAKSPSSAWWSRPRARYGDTRSRALRPLLASRSIGRLRSADRGKTKAVGEASCKSKSRRASRPSRPGRHTR